MTDIFRVFYILPTNFASLQASKITAKYEKRGNIGHILWGRRPITSLSLTHEIPTVFSFSIYQVNQEINLSSESRINFYF